MLTTEYWRNDNWDAVRKTLVTDKDLAFDGVCLSAYRNRFHNLATGPDFGKTVTVVQKLDSIATQMINILSAFTHLEGKELRQHAAAVALGMVSLLVVFQLVASLDLQERTESISPDKVAALLRALVPCCKEAIKPCRYMSDIVDTAVFLVDSAAPHQRDWPWHKDVCKLWQRVEGAMLMGVQEKTGAVAPTEISGAEAPKAPSGAVAEVAAEGTPE
ncbi:hypothetical protein PENSPDRAFT_693317 [Peniophora sp. CONT]|nr:hypothetical protein PENSPDRAFT_693317 [Peniophora sp. CONT]